MRILAIDASALAASAAILEDGKLLGEFFLDVGLTHSATLMPMIDALLRFADVPIGSIDRFAVTNGPGSFTGVRIGVATVKGLAMAQDKPCIAVSSLEAAAYNLPFFPGVVCCAMDARRNQVYTALFRGDGDRMERLLPDSAMSIEELGMRLQSYGCRVAFVGDGAKLCADKLSEMLPKIYLAPGNLRYPRAGGAARAAMFADHTPCTAAELSVSYLRLSQAERERNQKMEAQKP